MGAAKRVLQVLVVAVTLIVGGLALAIVATQTVWFKNWLRGYIVREAHQYLNGQISVGRVGGNLFYGIELEDVDVVMDGRSVVSVKDIGLRYNAFELVSRGLSIESIRINQPVVHLKRDGDGWSIGRLIKKERQEANRQGPGRPITIEDIRMTAGSIVFDTPVASSGVTLPSRIEDIDAQATFRYKPVRYSVGIAHLSFRGMDPALVVNKLSAGISVHEDELSFSNLTLRTASSSITLDGAVQSYLSNPSLKMQIASDGASLAEMSRIVPSLAGLPFQPSFRLNVNGLFDRLAVDMDVRSAAGDVSGQMTANLMGAERAVQGTLSVRHLDLAQLLNKPDIRTDLTGTLKPDLRAASFAELDSLRGTVDFDGSRVVAANYAVDQIRGTAWIKGRDLRIDGRGMGYGAAATFKGTLTLPRSGEALGYNLSGNLQKVNLSRLPAPLRLPGVDSNLNGSYHATGTGAISLRGNVLFADSQIAGATVRSGSTAEFSGHNLASKSRQLEYSTTATMAGLDLQQVGRAFSIPALDDDRYRTSLNAHVQAAGRVGPHPIEATIAGELVDSTLFRGHVQQLSFDAQLANDALHVKANGNVTDWDPKAVKSDLQFEGAIAGSLDVDGTISNLSEGFDPAHIDGAAKLMLGPSHLAGVHVERGTFEGRIDRQLLDVQVLDIQGPQVDVQAKGTVSLAPDGASNLEVHADSSDLSEIGKLVNQPVTGIAKLDAKVTGNRTSSRVEGTLLANDVAYQSADALVLVTEFTADIPNLSVRDAKVSATSNVTFVSIAGQHINEFSAKTTYERSQLGVDLTATQPQRSLNAAGSVLFHPDHQEVHLTRLDLSSQNLHWQLRENADANIRYGAGVTTVEGLRLVSGNQVIDAAGAIGKGDEALTVTLENVDLQNVDAILLRAPQFSGLINGSGTITGVRGALGAKASFSVNQGGFRRFRYESFKGTVDLVGNDVTIDSELQQNPSAWLLIKGHIPLAAFRGSGEESRDTESSDDRIDLQIESTPIDLGVVQGFTTVLTNVTGTAQANIQLKGSARNPSPTGTIVVTNGAFTVDPTGVSYAHFNGRIELQGDRAHIVQLDVLDNHDQWVSLTGDMPIRPSDTGDVSLQITARDLKVVDNTMGNVRIDSDLNLTGELRALRLSGDLAISTGTVNLDPLLAAISGSGYATTPTEYLPATSKSSAQDASTQGPAFGFAGMRMNVRLRVPDDLVVRSRDLRIGSSPIGFGAINVTLGGDLVATKDPGETVRLVGTVNAVRGNYQFQGRQFAILRDGLIRFNGDPINQLNPALDVRTQRIIQGVQANANIRGTLRRPRIQLTSVPPLERADIFSLIVFNQPVNQLGEGQQISLGQRAEQLALGSLAGGLSSSLGNLLNVSEFQLQTSPDSNSAAQLTVGQQVSQNLFVKVEYSVGDVSTTNLVLEYELRKWLRLQTNLIQAASAQQGLFQAVHDSGFDLIFTFTR